MNTNRLLARNRIERCEAWGMPCVQTFLWFFWNRRVSIASGRGPPCSWNAWLALLTIAAESYRRFWLETLPFALWEFRSECADMAGLIEAKLH